MSDMSAWDFPNFRRVIAVIDDHELDTLKYIKDPTGLMTNDEAQVISWKQAIQNKDKHPVIQSLERAGQLRPGQILVQNPFDPDHYMPQTEALQTASLQKFLHFSHLCMLLGACEVAFEELEITDEQDQHHGTISGGKKDIVNSDFDIKHEIRSRISKELALVDSFNGGEPDIDAARDFFRNKWPHEDPLMGNMIDMLSRPGHRLSERQLRFNTSTEVNRNLQVCAGVDLSEIASLNSSFDARYNSQMSVLLKVRVRFGQV